MVEFLDKGRAGMASTFLVRMKVGPILVDAKGVSRLYETRVRKRDLLFLVLAAFFTLVVITVVSEPVRLVLRGFLLPFSDRTLARRACRTPGVLGGGWLASRSSLWEPVSRPNARSTAHDQPPLPHRQHHRDLPRARHRRRAREHVPRQGHGRPARDEHRASRAAHRRHPGPEPPAADAGGPGQPS